MKQNVVRGSTLRIKSTVYSDDGITIANITGATITVMIKKSSLDIDSAALFTKTVGSGVTITNGPLGLCEALFSATETLTFKPGPLYYEVLVKTTTNEYIRSGIVEFTVDNNIVKALN